MVAFKSAKYFDRLEIELSEEEENKLNFFINHHRSRIETHRTEFLNRHNRFLYNWDDFITAIRKGPWDGSSNIHVPLTAIVVKTYHSRFYNLFSNPSIITMNPRDTYDNRVVAAFKKLHDFYLWDYLNGFKGLRTFTREIFMDAVTVGFGIGVKTWEIKQRKSFDLTKIDTDELVREVNDLASQVPEGGEELQTEEEMEEAKVIIKPYKEVQKVVTIFEGTRLITKPFEDVYFPNEIHGSSDMDQPRLVAFDDRITLGQAYLRVKQGHWSQERFDKLKQESFLDYSMYGQQIKKGRSDLSGYSEVSNDTDLDDRILQYNFCTYDIDDDGLDEEIVVERSSNGTIMKVYFLEQLSLLGMRPIIKVDCFTKPRQAYSRGIPEYMFPLNEEVDLLHNMTIDALSIQTVPFGVYRSSSSLKNEPIRIALGKFIPVDEVTDLRILNFPITTPALNNMESLAWNYAGRLSTSSELNQGITPDTVGATRSTSGVITLLQQMEKEIKPSIDHNAEQWVKLIKMIHEDIDYRLDPLVKMRVLGPSVVESPFFVQNNTNLAMNLLFDVKINVADLIHSDEVKRNEARLNLEVTNTPGIAHQLGIIGPKALTKAYADYYTAFGKNPEDFLDQVTLLQNPLSLFQEIQICGQGDIPPLAMTDDHNMKAQMLSAFMKEPEFNEAIMKGIYVPNASDLMMKTIAKHLDMARSMQPRGMPNSSGDNKKDFNKEMSNDRGGEFIKDSNSTQSNGQGREFSQAGRDGGRVSNQLAARDRQTE